MKKNTTLFRQIFLALMIGLALLPVGCGADVRDSASDDDDEESDSNNSNNNNQSGDNSGDSFEEESSWCCINGAYYECDSQSEAQQCFNNWDPGSCQRRVGLDGNCSSSDSDDDWADDENSTDDDWDSSDDDWDDSTSSYTCCLNGSFYVCPNQSANDQCFDDWNPSSCSRTPSRDGEC